jgi:hypothetical protein
MKRLIPLALLGAVAAIALGATCTIRNESLNKIGDHDTFAGELENESGVDILNHKMQVTFLNDSLAVVETRTIDGCLRSLQDGASDFFSVASTLPAADTDVALARLAGLQEDPSFEIGTTEQANIAISDVTATRSGASLAVSGTVKNNDGDDLDDTIVCIVVYNDDDRVVTTVKDMSPGDLSVDESSAFSATIAVPEAASAVDHVDIWVDGLEDDTPTGPISSKDHAVAAATGTPTTTGTATSTPTATPTP